MQALTDELPPGDFSYMYQLSAGKETTFVFHVAVESLGKLFKNIICIFCK